MPDNLCGRSRSHLPELAGVDVVVDLRRANPKPRLMVIGSPSARNVGFGRRGPSARTGTTWWLTPLKRRNETKTRCA